LHALLQPGKPELTDYMFLMNPTREIYTFLKTAKVMLILFSQGGSPETIKATINGISLKYKKAQVTGFLFLIFHLKQSNQVRINCY
jgi:hypothetical protein